MLAAQSGDRHLAEPGQEVLADHTAVALDRERLAADLHVLAQIPLRQIGYCRRLIGPRPGPGLLARLDTAQERRSPLPRLVRRDRPVPAHRDPPGPPGSATLHQIRLHTVGIDPDPEAAQIPVPVDDLLVARPQAVDHAVRQRLLLQSRHVNAPRCLAPPPHARRRPRCCCPPLRRHLLRLPRQVRVTRRTAHVRVAEKPPDHRKCQTERQRPRGEAVTEIVDLHVLHPGALPHPVPLTRDRRQVAVGPARREYPRAPP